MGSRFTSKQPRASVPICWQCDQRLWGAGRFYTRMLDPAGHPRCVHKGCVEAAVVDGLTVAEEQPKPPKRIERSARPKQKRKAARRSGRVRDEAWLAEVRQLSCCARFMAGDGGCKGRIEADHAGRRGLGQKSSDREAIPMCTRHHRWRTDASGPFSGWDAERMRSWCDWAIGETQVTVTARRGSHGRL